MKSTRGTYNVKLRGGNGEAFLCEEHESMDSGPSDTGKTVAMCAKAHALCLKHPGAQGLIARKTKDSLRGTVLQTWARVIKDYGVQQMGGDFPSLYKYPNGSKVWVGGLDKPDKFLSAERDFTYVNQAEEIAESDWETLGSRCTGRGAVVPHPQVFGDCNPAGSQHWILRRAKAGKLKLFVTTHKDNPSLYRDDGTILPEGQRRIDTLASVLTGIRRKRLLDGLWATAEGAIYEEFDKSRHVTVRAIQEFKRWMLCQDEGFTHPAVILLVGADSDDRWHVLREYYERGVLQAAVVKRAREWWVEFGCELDAVDESAAGLIADLQDAGVGARGGKGRVLDGISALQNRLAVQGDGRPRLTVDPGCVNLINEFESYVWAKDKVKEQPVKENDHALDALRYLEDVTGEPTGAWASADGAYTGADPLALDGQRLSFGAEDRLRMEDM